MAVSCAGDSLTGAWVTAGVDQVTASPASVTNVRPPGANGGSVVARALEDRARSSHGLPRVLPPVLLPTAVMPSDDPLGRGWSEQPRLNLIMSWTAPVLGLVASQL